MDLLKIENAVHSILEAIGEDPNREGLMQTPKRVAKMLSEIFSGLGKNPKTDLSATFSECFDGSIAVKDIFFYSMCEHHLLPFFGKAHIIYHPTNCRIAGLGQLAKIVDTYARRPQIQERMTTQIADSIMDCLQPSGVLVVVEAEHLCVSMRGVLKPGSKAKTVAYRGIFTDPITRQDALHML